MPRPIHFTHARLLLATLPLSATALFLVAGCASLDSKLDIDRAAATVAQRAGVQPVWNKPWATSLATSQNSGSSWDGRAPLTVEQALAMALRNNREIRAEVELIAASRADLVQAGLLPNPVVALTLGFPFDPVSGGTFVGASLVQSFTALWLRDGKIKAADARLNQSVLNVSNKALGLVAGVRATHTRIVFGQRAMSLSDDNLATIWRTIDSLDARVRGGEGTSLDVNRARHQLAKVEAERTVVLRELAKERRQMLELIGFAAENADWSAQASTDLAPIDTLDEPAVMARASAHRLDIAAARMIVEAQQADLSTEERSRLKDLELGADFERDADGAKSIGPVIEVGIPIFDANQAQIAKAGSLARAALANYEAISQRATREVRVAWVELDSASRLANQHRQTVLVIAEQNVALSQSALKSGQADVTVVLDAQRELIDARQTLSALERDAALAWIALEQAAGGTLNLIPTQLPVQ